MGLLDKPTEVKMSEDIEMIKQAILQLVEMVNESHTHHSKSFSQIESRMTTDNTNIVALMNEKLSSIEASVESANSSIQHIYRLRSNMENNHYELINKVNDVMNDIDDKLLEFASIIEAGVVNQTSSGFDSVVEKVETVTGILTNKPVKAAISKAFDFLKSKIFKR